MKEVDAWLDDLLSEDGLLDDHEYKLDFDKIDQAKHAISLPDTFSIG